MQTEVKKVRRLGGKRKGTQTKGTVRKGKNRRGPNAYAFGLEGRPFLRALGGLGGT